MSDEKQEFMDRLVKWEGDCWEFRKPDGTRYPSNASPLWREGEAFRHAAVRLLGSFLGPVKRGWFVKSRKTCVRFCVNPLHLTVKPNGRYPESRPERILSKPPPFVPGEGPGPLYVQDRRVRPMLIDEDKYPDLRPKVNRPGFAGAGRPDPPPLPGEDSTNGL
jgi:hypothetical protein